MITDQLPPGKFRMWPSIFVTAFFPGGCQGGVHKAEKDFLQRMQARQ
jgi:hypothetical protein